MKVHVKLQKNLFLPMKGYCSETQSIYSILRVLQVQTPPRFCAIVQLLQLNVSVLGLPVPLLPAGLNVLRCVGVDLLVGVLVVQQQQLLGQAIQL